MTTGSIAAPGLVRRALGGHAAIGLLAGALIYLVSLSGTLIVIHDRWERWEQPDGVEVAALSPDAAQAALVATMAAERGKPPTTHFYLRFPTDDLPRAVASTDSSATLVDGRGRLAGPERNVWTEFLIGLHEYLHLPATFGLIVVGMIGVALAAATVTGVVAHPRIFRDAFRLRLRQDPQLARADWHNRLGVWTLPFVLAIAFTGAFIGLGSLGFSALANAYHGGDLEAAYAPIFGKEIPPDAAPAPLPDIARAIGSLQQRVPQASPTYVIVHAPGTRGQSVQIIAEHARRLIYGESYLFDARGGWMGPAGLSDGALGQQLAASTYNLHFGNYGGLAVELAYMAFGLALCVVTATGVSLWLGKRRRRGLKSDRLVAFWRVVVWATPLLLLVAAWISAIAGRNADLVVIFWGALATVTAIAVVKPALISATMLKIALATCSILTGAAHLILSHASAAPVIAIDLFLIGAPVAVVLATRWCRGSPHATTSRA